jgi:hypothetical protein
MCFKDTKHGINTLNVTLQGAVPKMEQYCRLLHTHDETLRLTCDVRLICVSTKLQCRAIYLFFMNSEDKHGCNLITEPLRCY